MSAVAGRSYAVLWSEPRRGVETGKLELEFDGLRFEGAHRLRGACVHRLDYDAIDGVHIARRPWERLHGRPVVVVDRTNRGPLRIGSIGGLGMLSELADELERRVRRRS
jgi:hypothetical protein